MSQTELDVFRRLAFKSIPKKGGKCMKKKEESHVPGEVRETSLEGTLSEQRYQSWIDSAINDFHKGGGLNDLPGKGKPLNLEKGDAFSSILKNANVLPPWIELQHEIRDAIKTVINDLDTNPNLDIQERVSEINKKIAKYNNSVPTSVLQKTRIFPDIIRDQYQKWI